MAKKKYKKVQLFSTIFFFALAIFPLFQGFARYSTDAKWHVPHFEKMLYDQAQLAVAYSYAYQSTKDKKYAAIVEDILTYVNRYVKEVAILK